MSLSLLLTGTIRDDKRGWKMKKIDKVLKELSRLYEFNRQIRKYKLKPKKEESKPVNSALPKPSD